ncbi:hypothetical protein CEXT_808871 [Caerostris extrusa]|uniref:Uncharacterized protein n=1 Tax=Caerostris extrusa TaxID=172846 RepID=A0AAV4WXI7_CAEEX|nr:hypothetical protein CEXT_808871 [Caerostris extrusa]
MGGKGRKTNKNGGKAEPSPAGKSHALEQAEKEKKKRKRREGSTPIGLGEMRKDVFFSASWFLRGIRGGLRACTPTNSFFDLWPDLLVSWGTVRKMGMCSTLGPFLNHGVGVEKFCVD